MRKRTESLIANRNITPQSHPVICALLDYAAQNPGLEFANYGQGTAGVKAYMQESRSISAQWRKVKQTLECGLACGIQDDDILDAAPFAYSGRLEIDRTGKINYCTGQYWPTEYRAAVCAVLADAVRIRQKKLAEKTGQKVVVFRGF